MIRIVRRLRVIGALAIAACAPCPYPQTQPAPAAVDVSAFEPATRPRVVRSIDSVRVVQVQILTTAQGASDVFTPRVVRARQGDLLRFQMADGLSIHNVSFAHFDNDSRGAPLPSASPFLTQQGQMWQMRIDLPPGTYEFACIPHHALGHRGTLIVEE